MPDVVERFAPAKVNLALHVLGRRPDGYHDLDTLAVFADVGDRVRVRAADALTLSVAGPFASHVPGGGENLVLRAARLLKERAGVSGGASIELEKNIPAGAGFGGGSADAAATLVALNGLWDLRLMPPELCRLGSSIGADIAMCIAGKALRARGAGDCIDPLGAWPALPLVLVWPGRPLPTAAVFAALERRENPPLRDPPEARPPEAVAAWLTGCRNDLQAPALRLAPEIEDALGSLRDSGGCLVARMSGSGSGCFGLYGEGSAARAAAAMLRETGRRWWIQATGAR